MGEAWVRPTAGTWLPRPEPGLSSDETARAAFGYSAYALFVILRALQPVLFFGLVVRSGLDRGGEPGAHGGPRRLHGQRGILGNFFGKFHGCRTDVILIGEDFTRPQANASSPLIRRPV